MTDAAIQVENLGKRYNLGQQTSGARYQTLRETISQKAQGLFRRKTPPDRHAAAAQEFWALRDVSFEIRKGEVVGIVGRNGAGKSTLLKILSRITEPTTGRVRIHGRVASLLEVGTGFHPELTGRENVYLNGAILGMSRAEIRSKFEEIVAFAEVERFLDTPVKRYSSGMYVRLAFAVAAHLEPEILVIDEVLAVGDAQFQSKCLGKMRSIGAEGRTVLFVSHNLGAVESMCQRAIYLKRGEFQTMGGTREVIGTYLQNAALNAESDDPKDYRLKGCSNEASFTRIELHPSQQHGIPFANEIRLVVQIVAVTEQSDLTISGSIFNHMEMCVGTFFSQQSISVMPGKPSTLEIAIPKMNLTPGKYSMGLAVGRGGITSTRQDYDIVLGLPRFEVMPSSENGYCFVEWHANWGNIMIEPPKISQR